MWMEEADNAAYDDDELQMIILNNFSYQYISAPVDIMQKKSCECVRLRD